MMDRLRTVFLIVALILILLVILIETGTNLLGVLPSNSLPITSFQLPPTVMQGVDTLNRDQPGAIDQFSRQKRPSGLSIPGLALLDGIVLFTVALMGAALILPQELQSKVQGIATLVFSLLIIIIAILAILFALGSLILMISLLLSVPFGTIVYLIIYGGFNRAGAYIVLSLLMLLKLGLSISLFVAQERFLQNKGLVLLIFTSLVCNLIVSFLLGLVPGFLASITDAIAAIVVGIIAIIWGIFLLIGSIISIIRVLRVDRS